MGGGGKSESGHRIERTHVDWLFLLKMFGCWEVEGVSLNTDYILHIHPCDIGEPLMIIMLTEMITTTGDRWISMLRTLIYVCVDRSSLLPCESRLSFGACHVFLVVWTPTIVFYPSLGKSTHCMLELGNLKCNGKRAYNWRCRKCMNLNMRSSHT